MIFALAAILIIAIAALAGALAAARRTDSASAQSVNAGTERLLEASAPSQTPEPTAEPTPEPTPEPLDYGVSDIDGDGIISQKFSYKGATIYITIVLDPDRVFIGTADDNPEHKWGYGATLDTIVEKYGAVGGINAGGFVDDNGTGSGWPPDGITYSNGVCFNDQEAGPVAGICDDGVFRVGNYSYEECEALGMRDAVSFGPLLIIDGERNYGELYDSNLCPRTAIGQREDGAIVMLIADGRQAYSTGITYNDCADILYEYGCVNAANMDGGNSTSLWYNGSLINRPANAAGGTRDLPDAWLIKPLASGETGEFGAESDQALYSTMDASDGTPVSGETLDELTAFTDAFADVYYGFFGTVYVDYYYPELCRFVKEGSDLRTRMDQAAGDRQWINAGYNNLENRHVISADRLSDGTYRVVYGVDITEYATYWQFQTADELVIYLEQAPESTYGWLATRTE